MKLRKNNSTPTESRCRPGVIRRRVRQIALLAAFASSWLSAQTEFLFSGYVVDLPSYQRVNDVLSSLSGVNQDQFYNLTRLRLRPTLVPWTDGELSLEYEVTGLYRSEYSTLVETELPKNQLVDLSWTLIDNPHFAAKHFVDRLYFKQIFPEGELVVGRQRISMGTGRIWNPTDLFNPINPANFSKIEKDGVDAVTGRIYMGNFTDVAFVYNPYDDFASQNLGAKFRSNVAEYDFSVMGGMFGDRTVVGGDFAGNFFDAGLRGEGIYSADKRDFKDGFAKFILGMDNQFTPDLYALVEYHYNGEGKRNTSDYITEIPRLLRGEILNLGREYLAAMGSYLVHPLVNTSVTYIANLVDGSGVVTIIILYSVAQEAAITLGGQIPFGRRLSEYWYYPASAFGQIEYYF